MQLITVTEAKVEAGGVKMKREAVTVSARTSLCSRLCVIVLRLMTGCRFSGCWTCFKWSVYLTDQSQREAGWEMREAAGVLSTHIHTHSTPASPSPPLATFTYSSHTIISEQCCHQHAGGELTVLCVCVCVQEHAHKCVACRHKCMWLSACVGI